MRIRTALAGTMRFFAYVALVLALLAIAALCLVRLSHRYDNKTYMVVDADTLQPVEGAEVAIEPVSLSLPRWLEFLLPRGDTGRTDAHGLVTLRVARDQSGFLMGAAAPGYEMTGQRPSTFREPENVDGVFFLLPEAPR
ncbi:MAG: hypothetical protein WD847_21175 [Pirellulales bacterium]